MSLTRKYASLYQRRIRQDELSRGELVAGLKHSNKGRNNKLGADRIEYSVSKSFGTSKDDAELGW